MVHNYVCIAFSFVFVHWFGCMAKLILTLIVASNTGAVLSAESNY